MNTTNRNTTQRNAGKGLLVSALLVGTVLAFAPAGKAEAAMPHGHHWAPPPHHHGHRAPGFGIFLGAAPRADYVPGHYETRTDTVLVAPERIEKRWVAPVFETRYNADGTPYTVKVCDGYWTTVNLPARYETRVVQVWVPGYYASSPGPRVGFGLGIRF
jgi:hypothetical protein